jgi:hypothetical protein
VRRHERDRVYEDAELSGAHGESVEVELTDGRVGAKQVVTAKGTPGDHHGVAREHEAELSHARWTRAKRARVPERDFNALRGLPWRIPSSAAADATLGGKEGGRERTQSSGSQIYQIDRGNSRV